MKTLNDFNFKNKKALIRVDFNVPLNEHFEVTDATRILSAKPTIIKMNNNNQAHNLNGAAIEYMDGTKLYMAYGNLIPSYIVTTSLKDITIDLIMKEQNADYRRYLIERIGIERYIQLADPTIVDVIVIFRSFIKAVSDILIIKNNKIKIFDYIYQIKKSRRNV